MSASVRSGFVAESLRRDWQNDTRRKKARAGFTVQEKLGADAIGGVRTRGSGCSQRPEQKGDAVSDVFRLSGKTTGKASASVRREWWDEISAQAHATGRVPVLMVGFDATASAARVDLLCFERATAKNMQQALVKLLQGDVAEALAYAQLAAGREKV